MTCDHAVRVDNVQLIPDEKCAIVNLPCRAGERNCVSRFLQRSFHAEFREVDAGKVD